MIFDLSLFVKDCAPRVAPDTMLAIIKTESRGNPLVIGDNTLRRSFASKTKEDAVRLAYSLIKKGHNLDFGLTQVNLANAKKYHLTLNDVFDPCKNIKYGALILESAYLMSSHKKSEKDALLSSFSIYNTGTKEKGFKNGYVKKVLENSCTVSSSPNH